MPWLARAAAPSRGSPPKRTTPPGWPAACTFGCPADARAAAAARVLPTMAYEAPGGVPNGVGSPEQSPSENPASRWYGGLAPESGMSSPADSLAPLRNMSQRMTLVDPRAELGTVRSMVVPSGWPMSVLLTRFAVEQSGVENSPAFRPPLTKAPSRSHSNPPQPVEGSPSLSMPTFMTSSSDDGHESNVFTEKRHVADGQS